MSGLNRFLLAILLCNLLVLCSAEADQSAVEKRKNGAEFVGRMIEEGYTKEVFSLTKMASNSTRFQVAPSFIMQ